MTRVNTADLRTTILTKLAGSSKDKPVEHNDLQSCTADVCTDLDELDDALDKLLDQRIVNTVGGMAGGKQYRHYWLTGTAHPAQPFNLTDRPRHLECASTTAPVQRTDTSVHSIKKPTATTQPTHKENPMSKRKSGNTGNKQSQISAALLALAGEQPGIGGEHLIELALKRAPGATKEQAVKARQNLMHASKKLRAIGPRSDLVYYLNDGTAPAKRPIAEVKPKTSKAAAKKLPAKKKKPEKPRITIDVLPPRQEHHDFQCEFGLRGIFTLSKGAARIQLDAHEALQLMNFASHQLSYADQI